MKDDGDTSALLPVATGHEPEIDLERIQADADEQRARPLARAGP